MIVVTGAGMNVFTPIYGSLRINFLSNCFGQVTDKMNKHIFYFFYTQNSNSKFQAKYCLCMCWLMTGAILMLGFAIQHYIITPNFDFLAKTGVFLDRHYVFKYCSPSRASFLTGRWPHHAHQYNNDPSVMVYRC